MACNHTTAIAIKPTWAIAFFMSSVISHQSLGIGHWALGMGTIEMSFGTPGSTSAALEHH
nr:hypothetical protein [Nostoc sp. SerVER01]